MRCTNIYSSDVKVYYINYIHIDRYYIIYSIIKNTCEISQIAFYSFIYNKYKLYENRKLNEALTVFT